MIFAAGHCEQTLVTVVGCKLGEMPVEVNGHGAWVEVSGAINQLTN